MALIRTWKESLATLDKQELVDYANALSVLIEWDLFRHEYEGLHLVNVLINQERIDRANK